ncbi:MAG: helix-turn-helix transcriptional regulator [Faecalibacterium sp.]
MMLFAIIIVYGSIITLVVLVIRALIKYLRSDSKKKPATTVGQEGGLQSVDAAMPQGQAETLQSLGEALKNARTARKFTQEYVADTLGVSRQAVSKWENGSSDPSTSNLIALAKLYEVSVETLLAGV